MSQRQTLAIVQALLEDDAVGLRATVERLASSLPNAPGGNPGPLVSQFTFYRGKVPGIRPSAGGVNIMLRPVRWVTNTRVGLDVREGISWIEIGGETFSASPDDQVDEMTLVATALLHCLDGLRVFSDANKSQFGSCVVDVATSGNSIDVSFGDFEGPTSYGFLARVPITEFSYDD